MTLTDWTNLSIVWLSFLAFILGIVPLVLLFFAVRGMMAVNRSLPRYLKLGQYYSRDRALTRHTSTATDWPNP